MSFDWSSIIGTFAGTFGAYYVARKSFLWQEKKNEPQLLAKRYDFIQRLHRVFSDGHGTMMVKSVEKQFTNHEFRKLIDQILIEPLNHLAVESVELHDGIFGLVQSSRLLISARIDKGQILSKVQSFDDRVRWLNEPVDRLVPINLAETLTDLMHEAWLWEKKYLQKIYKLESKVRRRDKQNLAHRFWRLR